MPNLARADGRGTQELLTLHMVECCLTRLSVSPHADRFGLKGGILLALQRRSTADADALARGFANDEASVVSRVSAIAAQVPDDGVVSHAETITSHVIRDQELYSAVRIAMDAGRVAIHRRSVGRQGLISRVQVWRRWPRRGLGGYDGGQTR